jgi:hypothetical protein
LGGLDEPDVGDALARADGHLDGAVAGFGGRGEDFTREIGCDDEGGNVFDYGQPLATPARYRARPTSSPGWSSDSSRMTQPPEDRQSNRMRRHQEDDTSDSQRSVHRYFPRSAASAASFQPLSHYRRQTTIRFGSAATVRAAARSALSAEYAGSDRKVRLLRQTRPYEPALGGAGQRPLNEGYPCALI